METKHTPIPWNIVRSRDITGDVGITADGMGNVLAEVFAEAWAKGDVRPGEAYANAAFIVEAANNHDRLIAENVALKQILTDLRAELDDYSDVIDNPEGGSPRPNVAMRLMQMLDEKMAAIDKVMP